MASKKLMFNSGYLSDMKIVDERLTKLEKGYEEISKLLTGLSMDLKLITNGGKSGVKEETKQERKSKSKV